MISMESIRTLTEKIVEQYHPQQVILFGSYAYGAPTADSDVDLLVILSCQDKASRKAAKILNTVNPQFPVGLRAVDHLATARGNERVVEFTLGDQLALACLSRIERQQSIKVEHEAFMRWLLGF